jgi:dTDP-4-amino-4,6-dideoxygalactose transaminase
VLDTPFAPWPSFSKEEAEAVSQALLSNRVNYWTGDRCRAFEREFANWTGVSYAVALMNGTVALDVALRALGIGANDEVIVTPRTFMASVSCVANAGATPVFVDVDLDSQNMAVAEIERAITPRTRAIIPVHLGGWPCEMDAIMELAAAHGLFVIEDCAQAHGGRYRGRGVGSIGHIGAWSFCQDKILTTGGEGGMVTTNDARLWSLMWSYKDHGKSWEAVHNRKHPPGFRWVHESFGTNWRMLELQAAIGRVQLGRIEDWHRMRTANARRLIEATSECVGLRVPVPPSHVEHAWYRFYAFVRRDALRAGWDRDRIVAAIKEQGVPCFVGTCSEVYLEKAFDGTGWRPRARLPVARELGETSLAFLVHPTLTADEMDMTCDVVRSVMAAATR